jgi:hypothetical protein
MPAGSPQWQNVQWQIPFLDAHTPVVVQVQDTRLRMPNKWHMYKEGKAGNKKRHLLVFSELPSLPSAGSRPGCFHSSLWVSRGHSYGLLWAVRLFKKM